MSELTQKQKNKILAAAEIVEKGDFAVVSKILELGDKIDESIEKIDEAVNEAKETIDTFTTESETKLDAKIADIKDGQDYVLTEEDKSEIASKITVPVVEKIIEKTEVIKEQPIVTEITKVTNEIKEVAITETPEQLRDKLETLKEDERLDKSAIKGLEEELKRIEKTASTPRGGGTSAMGVAQAFKYIGKTEALVGNIDGVNTTYLVSSNIWWVACLVVNGEVVAQLPNYTISGKSITFASALPAAYSGKDVEIKFIGT